MNRDQLPASQIKRCATRMREIVWTVPDGSTLAKLPVDPNPNPAGTIRLTVTGKTVTAHVLPAKLAFGHTDLHLSHWATCPHANRHRRRPARRKARA